VFTRPNIETFSLDNDNLAPHSNMFYEGYWHAKEGKPMNSPYTPRSEPWEDWCAGWRAYTYGYGPQRQDV
jgi:hypothetical protein